MPMAMPMRKGVAPGMSRAWMAKTGRMRKSPSMRMAKMPASPAEARRSAAVMGMGGGPERLIVGFFGFASAGNG